jgi:hypothetical protein
MREISLRFEINLSNLLFSLTVLYINYSLSNIYSDDFLHHSAIFLGYCDLRVLTPLVNKSVGIEYSSLSSAGGKFDVETLVKAILDLGETKTEEVVPSQTDRDLGRYQSSVAD